MVNCAQGKATILGVPSGAVTERTSKPDFLFPGISHYRDLDFRTELLTMLASKSSLKDRWRQVTKEADRVALKHVFTLEKGISEAQTREMQHQSVQLILPKALHKTYKPTQIEWIWDLARFVEHVKLNQQEAGVH